MAQSKFNPPATLPLSDVLLASSPSGEATPRRDADAPNSLASSATSEPLRSASQVEEGIDEIESYFASLMQRVGGSTTANFPSTPRASAAFPARPASGTSEGVATGANSSIAPSPTPGVAAAPRLTELPKSRPAAESPSDLQILRAVANVHRKGAIDRHELETASRQAYCAWAIAGLMWLLSLWLTWRSFGGGVWQYSAALMAFAVSMLLTGAYFVTVRRFRDKWAAWELEHIAASSQPPLSSSQPVPPASPESSHG